MRIPILSVAAMMLCGAALAESQDHIELQVENVNCGALFSKQVSVHIYDSHNEACTNIWVKDVKQGEIRTQKVRYLFDEGRKKCRYKHEAEGTVMGKRDLELPGETHITCYTDVTVCQCVAS
ncbi:hypothetical protein [Hyphomonas sp.]|jgi:hypothetical protein|uniref:hypothetical protein n=1 Tax=Hyphomonas sp. TaxID=87 RepID=UPI0025C66D93|nr:hypothetical protein [Hyphomonas sp.]